MSEPSTGELLTTTIENYSKTIADAVTDNIAFYKLLKDKGLIVKESGGYDLREPIYYNENSTVQWYSGYEPFNLTPQKVLDTSIYSWKQCGVSVSISGMEERQNADSKTRRFNLLAGRIENAKKSLANDMERVLFADGTGSFGKELTGLAAHVSTTPSTGVHGGISAVDWSFWRNQATEFGELSAATIKSILSTNITPLRRGTMDRVDVVLMGDDAWNAALEAFQTQQQTAQSLKGEFGFESLVYNGAKLIHCGGLRGQLTTQTMYFLNTETFKLRVHESLNMSKIGDSRTPLDQDATVQLMGFMGNLTCNNRELNGVATPEA